MKRFSTLKDILNKQGLFSMNLTIILVVLSILLNQRQILQRWDNLFYDLESTSITRPANDKIVIVAIDDDSLHILGKWPWSRATHARLLTYLSKAGVAAIGMDLLFMEPDLRYPEDDQLLTAAIEKNGHVVLPALTSLQNNRFIITKPITKISEKAQLAHVNLQFDSQGIVRKQDLQLVLDNGQLLPSMALALSRLIPEYIESPELIRQKEIFINFAHPKGQFTQVSYADILLDAKVRKKLANKIVLVGITAAGLSSRFATPASKNQQLMSGIELQANALSTILSRQIVQPVNWLGYLLLSLLLLVIPINLFRVSKPSAALFIVLGFSALTISISFFLLGIFMLWFAPLPTLLCLILSYPLWSWYRLEQTNHSLFLAHEQANATLKAIGEALISTDENDCIEFMNPAAEKMLACTLTEVIQQPFSEYCQIVEQNDSIFSPAYALAKNNLNAESKIIRNNKKEEFAVRISSSPVYSENNTPSGVVYALSDLSEIININNKILFVATHDELTGLPNRVLLQDRLEQAIISAKRANSTFAILFIDLDGFKKINDAMGHASGDLLLQEVAIRIRSWVRLSDTIARWGGDEFIVLLDSLTQINDATDVTAKIQYSLNQPFLLHDQEVFITPSIGITLFPQDGQQTETLLAKADAAMYNIKQNGGNSFCFYSKDLENRAKEKLVLETELHQAIESGEFEMHYQPQVELKSGKLIGAEALIRWIHPKNGLLSPQQFIPLAEETGLIVAIGEWVVTTVCKQIESWQEQDYGLIKVAINLSSQQFLQKNLVSFITSEMLKYNVSSDLLQIEITESVIIQDINEGIKILDNLKSHGISIAIDDFGTGYSSLEYLNRLPIDKLKIDKSFIDNVLDSNGDASIVQAVISLGHNMNMKIIAEGIETEDQEAFLQQHLCDYGQGYLYSKPISAEKMGQLFEEPHQSRLGKPPN